MELSSFFVGVAFGALVTGAVLWTFYRLRARDFRARLTQFEADKTALHTEVQDLRQELNVSVTDATRQADRLRSAGEALVQKDHEIQQLTQRAIALGHEVVELKSAEREYVSSVLNKALDRVTRKLSGEITRYDKQKGAGFLRGPDGASVFFNVKQVSPGVRRYLENASGRMSSDGLFRYDSSIPVWFDVRQIRGERDHLVAGRIEIRGPSLRSSPVHEQPGRSGETTSFGPDSWREQE